MILLAHAGHWITSLAYFAPVVGFMVWLGLAFFRERRSERKPD